MGPRGRCRTLLGVVCGAATLSCAAAGSNVSALYNVSSRVRGLDAAQAIVTWPLKADHSPVGVVMAGGTLGNADVLAKAAGDDGALDQWKAKSKDAAKAAMDEVIGEVMEDDPDGASLGKSSSMYKELQDVAAKARKLTVKVPNIGSGGAASTAANAKAEAQAEAAAIMAASEAGVVDSYDMPAPPEAAHDAPFARRTRTSGVVRAQKRVVSGRPTRTRAIGASGMGDPTLKMLAKSRRAKGPSRHALTKRGATASDGASGAHKRALSAPLARAVSLLEQDPDTRRRRAAREAAGLATAGGTRRPAQLAEEDVGEDLGEGAGVGVDSGAAEGAAGATPRWRAIGGADGQRWPPFLTVFKNPPAAYVAACAVGGAAALAACAGAGWHIKRLLSCPHSARQGLYVRLAALIIVLAVTAVAALCFPKVAVFFTAIRAAYVGLCVVWAFELVCEMGGGFSELCYAIAAEDEAAALAQQRQRQPGADYSATVSGRQSGVASLSLAVSRRKLMAVWYGTQQYVYVSIAGGVTCVVLTGLGWYEEGVLPAHTAVVCLLIAVALSGVVAVGMLSLLHSLANGTLLRNKLYSTGKVTLVQGAIMVASLQPVALAVLMADGLLPGTPIFDTPARSTLWNNLLISFEAIVLFVITLRGFPVCARALVAFSAPLNLTHMSTCVCVCVCARARACICAGETDLNVACRWANYTTLR